MFATGTNTLHSMIPSYFSPFGVKETPASDAAQGLVCRCCGGTWLVIESDLRESLSPLLLGERNFATVVIGDDEFVGAVVDLHSRTAALDTAEPDVSDILFRISCFAHAEISL